MAKGKRPAWSSYMVATSVLLIMTKFAWSRPIHEGRFDLSCAKSTPLVAEPHSEPLHFSIDTVTQSYCEEKGCKSDNALAEVSARDITIYRHSGRGGLDNVYRYSEQAVFDQTTNVLTVEAEQGDIGPNRIIYACGYEPYTGSAFTSMH